MTVFPLSAFSNALTPYMSILLLRCCWFSGRKGIQPVKAGWWGVGMVTCPEQGADLHTAQLMPLFSLSLPSVKSTLVLPFWYQLTWVVSEKEPLKTCVVSSSLMILEYAVAQLVVAYACRCQCSVSEERS